jgi:hypothetical protein
MIGSITFHAAPTMIANVHRHANDCIVIPPVGCGPVGLQARCHGDRRAAQQSSSAVRQRRNPQLFLTGDLRSNVGNRTASVPKRHQEIFAVDPLLAIASLQLGVNCVEPGRVE